MSMPTPHPRTGVGRALLTLVGGQTIAQVVPIAASVLLTRLYTPHAYGTVSAVTAAAALLAAVMHGRYQRAIVVAQDDEERQTLLSLALLLSSVISLISYATLSVVLVMGNGMSQLIFAFPLLALLMTGVDCFNHYSLKEYREKDIARSNILRAVFSAAFQICFGFLSMGSIGLILGAILGAATGLTVYASLAWNTLVAKRPRFQTMAKTAWEYRQFPLLDLPANLIVVMTYNVLILMMPVLYSASVAGFVSISLRVLALPADFIGTAINQIYFRQLSDRTRSAEAHWRAHWMTALGLFAVVTPPILVVIFSGPALFAWAFGEEWRSAGRCAVSLAPMIWARMMATPFTSIFQVAKRQGRLLALQSCLFGSMALALGVAHFLNFKAYAALLLVACSSASIYTTFFIVATLTLRAFLRRDED